MTNHNFDKSIKKIMETDDLEISCKGWEDIFGKKKDVKSFCICNRPLKNGHFLYNNCKNRTILVGGDCATRLLPLAKKKQLFSEF